MKRLGSKRAAGWLALLFVLLLTVSTALATEATEPVGEVENEVVDQVAGEAPEEEAGATDGEGGEADAPEEAESAEAEHVSDMFGTFWALVPPLIAIALALITREVYTSLMVGIGVGALFYANFNVVHAMNTVFTQGLIAQLSDSWNIGILVFLVILGIMVQLMNKAGGSSAYGAWANERIKTRRGAQLATFGLGVLIFMDDYFNCLTVGSVMRPVTDRHKISRAKLAYLIDATAAPVCMIAPISSWAAAVSSVVAEGGNSLELFVRAIPYNFYSILTLVMIVTITLLKFDFGPMKRHEENALAGDLFTTPDRPYANAEEDSVAKPRSKVYDLLVPMLVLIASCIVGMVYTGGFFRGESFIDAFANCDASLGLSIGSFVALAFAFVYYLGRRVLSFKEFTEAIPKGFAAMVPAILILSFAWTLSAMTGLLGGAEFVQGIMEGSAAGFQMFLPCIIFAVACGMSFSTGTSWGTFGILLPIVAAVLEPGSEMLVISVSACLAGAVFGDHCSPISDTTIMASTGAQSNHINHVTTQLPYAALVAAVSFLFYFFAGAVKSAWIVLPLAVIAMVGALLLIRWFTGRASQSSQKSASQ